jgi:hypothetical protein
LAGRKTDNLPGGDRANPPKFSLSELWANTWVRWAVVLVGIYVVAKLLGRI